jgi:hypothetical protein
MKGRLFVQKNEIVTDFIDITEYGIMSSIQTGNIAIVNNGKSTYKMYRDKDGIYWVEPYPLANTIDGFGFDLFDEAYNYLIRG